MSDLLPYELFAAPTADKNSKPIYIYGDFALVDDLSQNDKQSLENSKEKLNQWGNRLYMAVCSTQAEYEGPVEDPLLYPRFFTEQIALGKLEQTEVKNFMESLKGILIQCSVADRKLKRYLLHKDIVRSILLGFSSTRQDFRSSQERAINELTETISPAFLLIVSDFLELFHQGHVWPTIIDGTRSLLHITGGQTHTPKLSTVLFRTIQPKGSDLSGCFSYAATSPPGSEPHLQQVFASNARASVLGWDEGKKMYVTKRMVQGFDVTYGQTLRKIDPGCELLFAPDPREKRARDQEEAETENKRSRLEQAPSQNTSQSTQGSSSTPNMGANQPDRSHVPSRISNVQQVVTELKHSLLEQTPSQNTSQLTQGSSSNPYMGASQNDRSHVPSRMPNLKQTLATIVRLSKEIKAVNTQVHNYKVEEADLRDKKMFNFHDHSVRTARCRRHDTEDIEVQLNSFEVEHRAIVTELNHCRRSLSVDLRHVETLKQSLQVAVTRLRDFVV